MTLTNTKVTGNSTTASGGGIYFLRGELTLINSTVSGNWSNSLGGGLYISGGTTTLTNSIVTGNWASLPGGGIYASSNTLAIANSTVSGNWSGIDGGGIYVSASTTTLTNSIVWGNGSGDISGTINSVSHAIVGGAHAACTSSSDCIDADPLFVDWVDPSQPDWERTTDGDYRLRFGSPAIDTGDDDLYDGDEFGDFDLDGNSRILGESIDLGAYEAQFTEPVLNLPSNFTVDFNRRNSVTWSASASDWTDSSIPVSCSPSSGSSFTVGQTTVQCEATDSLEQTEAGSFVVTVLSEARPKAPSFRNVPSDIVVPADGSGGSVVSYTMPTAVDQTDGDVLVSCEPESGSSFAIGHNTVTCTATNSLDLTSTTTFAVIVTPFTGDLPDFSPGDGPENQFFMSTWARTDLPVRDGHIARTWMWGPGPFTSSMWEPYTIEQQGDGEPVFLSDLPESEREVIYFDKARMEINDPDSDSDSLWFVTNGLLVIEMITGNRQFGDDLFKQYAPSTSNVAGDVDGTTGPTYASLQNVLDAPAQSVGTHLTQEIDRDGNVTDNPAWGDYGLTVGFVDNVTSHGIAAPFWDFMQSAGVVFEEGSLIEEALFENPFYATGRPITEAYWTTVPVAGEPRDVLMQCFERRCLTWTPGNDPGFVVEAGNVGQHYFTWRYVQQPD